jgi:hypothetical protein
MKIIELRKRIEQAINATSSENGSDTPDFILAEYLTDCLGAFDKAVKWREKWYGREAVLCEIQLTPPDDSTIPPSRDDPPTPEPSP